MIIYRLAATFLLTFLLSVAVSKFSEESKYRIAGIISMYIGITSILSFFVLVFIALWTL